MRIAFATLYDPQDVKRGSGSYYFMGREIERQVERLYFIGPVEVSRPLLTRVFKKLSRKSGKKYRGHQDLLVAHAIGNRVSEELRELDYDCLITNSYSIAGYTRVSKPIFLYTDAIFPSDYSRNVHPWLDDLFPLSVLFSQIVTRNGLFRSRFCFFPSRWAREEAATYGRFVEGKSEIIPFGANIPDPGGEIARERTFRTVVEKRQVDLLFVGKDWQLKGGEIAVTTARELNGRGIKAVLHVVGAETTSLPHASPLIRQYGRLDKSDRRELQQLDKLYRVCDVLIVPSTAEGFGIVFAEAAAYGMPSLAYANCGVTTAVKDGESGLLLEPGQPATAFANIVESWFANPAHYNRLAERSRLYFESTLNWKTAVSRLLGTIGDSLASNV